MDVFRQAVRIGLILVVGGILPACSGAGTNEGTDGGSSTDGTAPGAPSGLDAGSGDEAIELSWDAVGAGDLDGYNVYRDTTSLGSISDRSPVNDGPVGQTEFTDSSVDNGTTFHYRVTAVDESENEGNASGEVRATPFPTPPSRP